MPVRIPSQGLSLCLGAIKTFWMLDVISFLCNILWSQKQFAHDGVFDTQYMKFKGCLMWGRMSFVHYTFVLVTFIWFQHWFVIHFGNTFLFNFTSLFYQTTNDLVVSGMHLKKDSTNTSAYKRFYMGILDIPIYTNGLRNENYELQVVHQTPWFPCNC